MIMYINLLASTTNITVMEAMKKAFKFRNKPMFLIGCLLLCLFILIVKFGTNIFSNKFRNGKIYTKMNLLMLIASITLIFLSLSYGIGNGIGFGNGDGIGIGDGQGIGIGTGKNKIRSEYTEKTIFIWVTAEDVMINDGTAEGLESLTSNIQSLYTDDVSIVLVDCFADYGMYCEVENTLKALSLEYIKREIGYEEIQ